MEKTPPDFTKLFFDTLGGIAAPIRYPLRPGPCLLHDVAFLSSLLHDARVLNPRVDAVDGLLKVRLNRDCWELGAIKKDRSAELYIADAILTFRGVSSVSWQLPENVTEPWMDYVWIDDGFRTGNQFNLFLKGHNWYCRIAIDEEAWSVTLEDVETPHLHPAHHQR